MPQQFSELELQVLRDLGMTPNDPAAIIMLNRIAELKEQQLAGDPAFQAGSRYFGTRHGGQVETALSRFGPTGAGDDIQALINAALGAGGVGGGGGGGVGAIPWGSTREAATLAQQFALEQMAEEAGYETESARLQREWEERQAELGRTFEAGEAEKQREFQRQQALEELKAERQRIFTEMMGRDPVRAALFAMGVGGEILPGGERFAKLPPLAGAQEYGRRAATGLSQLLGRQVGVGEQGVTGLPEIYKAAGAYSAGQRPRGAGSVGDIEAARTMLLSGFGVGAKPGAGRPGLSREEALRKIQAVTPTGVVGR